MKYLNIIGALAFLLAQAKAGHAQLVMPRDTVQWEASAYMKHDGDSVQLSRRSRFTFYGDTTIRWQLLDATVSGPRTFIYRVTGVAGTLVEGADSGVISYTATAGGKGASIRIVKTGAVYTLHLALEKDDGTLRERDFDISGSTILH